MGKLRKQDKNIDRTDWNNPALVALRELTIAGQQLRNRPALVALRGTGEVFIKRPLITFLASSKKESKFAFVITGKEPVIDKMTSKHSNTTKAYLDDMVITASQKLWAHAFECRKMTRKQLKNTKGYTDGLLQNVAEVLSDWVLESEERYQHYIEHFDYSDLFSDGDPLPSPPCYDEEVLVFDTNPDCIPLSIDNKSAELILVGDSSPSAPCYNDDYPEFESNDVYVPLSVDENHAAASLTFEDFLAFI